MKSHLLREESFGGVLRHASTGTCEYLGKSEFATWATCPDVRVVGRSNPPEDRLSAPISVSMGITNRCNLHCQHCYMDSGARDIEELSVERWTSIVRQCGELGVFEIRFTGGEPTLRDDVFVLVSAAQEFGMTAALVSNGIWSPQVLARVLESTIDRFYISIEGTEPINDAVRGVDSYRQAINSIEALATLGRSTCINVHLRRANLSVVGSLVELAADLGVLIKFSPMRRIGRAVHNLKNECPGPTEIQAAVRAVEIARSKHPTARVQIDFDLGPTSAGVESSRHFDARGCHAARRMVGIDPLGRVYPCTFLWQWPKFIVGDLRHQTLADIWLHSTALHAVRETPRHSVCQACEHFVHRRCLGGCPAMAFEAHGNLGALDPCCYVAAATALGGCGGGPASGESQ